MGLLRGYAAGPRQPVHLAEQAVLAVVAAEDVKHGACTLTIDHVAALAGVQRDHGQERHPGGPAARPSAVEERRALGLAEPAATGVTITSREWCYGCGCAGRGVGVNSYTPRIQEDKKEVERSGTGLGLPKGRA